MLKNYMNEVRIRPRQLPLHQASSYFGAQHRHGMYWQEHVHLCPANFKEHKHYKSVLLPSKKDETFYHPPYPSDNSEYNNYNKFSTE